MFVGREREIAELNIFLEDSGKDIACVYGRKGIGKTTLLKHFAEGTNHFYFTAYPTTENEMLRFMGLAFGMKSAPESLSEALDFVGEKAGEDDFLLILDHYGDFVKAGADFEAVLQEYVNSKWANQRIKVILAEDLYLNVDKFVTGKKATWRINKVSLIEVGSLGIYDMRELLPEVSSFDLAFLYGLTGGIPSNVNRIQTLAGDEAIQRLFLEEEAAELSRPEAILSSELRELSYYNRMLVGLAAGNTRVNQISSLVEKPKDVVVPYFNTLMNVGMVQKENPITEKTNRKKTRYSIVNTSDEFWYRFIAPRMDLFYAGDSDGLLSAIHDDMDGYMHGVFVRMCREYLLKQSAKGELPFTIDELGNWWVNDDEKGTTSDFDMVALGKQQGKTATIFGRCYYSDEPVDLRELKELIDLTKMIEHNGDRFYLVFSKAGFHENAKTAAAAIWNIMLVTLEDIC